MFLFQLAAEIVRYLFTIFPSFPLVRSIMAIAQVSQNSKHFVKVPVYTASINPDNL